MYPIQIRENSPYGFEVSFDDAVRMAMGLDDETSKLHITPVYAEDCPQGKAGYPVHGLDVDLYVRRVRYGRDEDATVSIGGIRAHSPEVAMVRIACYTLAAQIAAAANGAAAAMKTAAQRAAKCDECGAEPGEPCGIACIADQAS